MPVPKGLYAIADASFGDPADLAMELAHAGCPLIQLRAKGWSTTEVARVATRLLEPLHQIGAKLIINDHVSVAAEVGADGVHLGQEDGSVQAARATLGAQAIIGLSTHSLEQAQQAKNVDYIGYGPIFQTTTKQAAGRARGTLALQKAVDVSSVPVIAIGGINRENLDEVRATGVHGWAIISDLFASGSIPENLRRLSIQP